MESKAGAAAAAADSGAECGADTCDLKVTMTCTEAAVPWVIHLARSGDVVVLEIDEYWGYSSQSKLPAGAESYFRLQPDPCTGGREVPTDKYKGAVPFTFSPCLPEKFRPNRKYTTAVRVRLDSSGGYGYCWVETNGQVSVHYSGVHPDHDHFGTMPGPFAGRGLGFRAVNATYIANALKVDSSEISALKEALASLSKRVQQLEEPGSM